MIDLWRYFEMGGVMMWPLMACSILLSAVLFERACVIVLGGVVLRRHLPSATRRAHRRVLNFFTDVPPSLGLLGTVFGVVQSFHLTDGHVSGETVGSGLAVACMTTIFGLSIAIVATVSGYLLDWLGGVEAS